MAIDPTALATLLAMSNAGQTIACAEYLEVRWDTGVISYYAVSAWQNIPPFGNIGKIIQPRIVPSGKRDPFHELEINPDLRTENINITFDDTDKAITDNFQTYSSGVTCIVHLYYPDVSLDIEIWWGQLQAPSIYGWKNLKTTITNGYRSRELTVPGRSRRKECTAQVFGGKLPDIEAVRSSLCPYDKHLGGSVGVNDPVTTAPYLDCPKTKEACIARLGTVKYFGGFNTDASAMSAPNQGNPYIAVSRGNASNLTEPIRVVFGLKYVRSNQLLLWRPLTPPGYEDGWIDAVWEVCEGPVQDIYNFVMNGENIGWNYRNIRLGTRGQSATYYTPDVSNFSSVAHVRAQHSHVDTALISGAGDLNSECYVMGFNEVCVYTDDAPLTKTRTFSADRAWCLLELYKNQKFGIGYAEALFEIADWMAVSSWLSTVVTFVATYADGETLTVSSPRSSFSAICEGRPISEIVEDICRGGAISVPFQHEGKFTLSTFHEAGAPELAAARVFYDSGDTPNIIREPGQPPMIELSQTPDNKLVNEIEVRFEESANGDIERPIIVDDPDQKLKAGRQLGESSRFLSVPKTYAGFGVSSFQEAVRLAYRLLKFGEFDEGGTDNNIRLKLTVPFEQTLGLKRYDIIKVVSDILDSFTLPSGIVTDTTRYAVEYFRILRMKKVANGRCEITAQAYNPTSYGNFESDGDGGGGTGANECTVLAAGTLATRDVYYKTNIVNGRPSFVKGPYTIYWDGTQWLLSDSNVDYYGGTLNVAFPWLDTWTVIQGTSPAPVCEEGITTIGPPCRIDLVATPTYDATKQQITIDIPPC